MGPEGNFNDSTGAPAPAYARLRRAYRPILRLFIGVNLLTLVTAAVWLYWNHVADTRLARAIAAAQATGQRVTVEDFQTEAVDPETNAASLLMEVAAEVFALDGKHGRINAWLEHLDQFPGCDEQGLPTLSDFEPLFKKFDAALARPDTDWGVTLRSPVISSMLLPHLRTPRTMTKFLCACAKVAALRGEAAQALNLLHQAVSLADRVDSSPFIMSVLTGTACRRLACDTLEGILPKLNFDNDESRAAAVRLRERLLEERGRDRAWVDAFAVERLLAYDCAAVMAPRDLFALVSSPPPGGAAFAIAGPTASLAIPAFKLDAVHLFGVFDGLMTAASAPDFPISKNLTPRVPTWSGLERLLHYPASILMPSLDRALYLRCRDKAYTRMGAIALTIQLHRSSRAAWPEDLGEMWGLGWTPPADPFHARGDWPGWISGSYPRRLFCVDGDGQDDGGQFVRTRRLNGEPPDLLFLLEPLDSKP